MKNNNRWIFLVLVILAAFTVAACGETAAAETEKPAHLEEIGGSEFKRVVLTERAAERLDIQTAQVSEEGGKMVVPYSTIIYGLHGETWLYTQPQPLTYERHVINVDRIEGGLIYLLDGPELGTEVVTIGVIELYGEETGIKK